jgi:predicted dehydrogenase
LGDIAMYNAAVIGLGNIGLMYDFDSKRTKPSSHTLAYIQSPDLELVAAADTRLGQESFLNQLAPGVQFYSDYQKMLSDQAVDLVSICTDSQTRVELVRYIVENTSTKLIFCEKPLSSTVRDAASLLSVLDSYTGYFIPNLSRRWNTGILGVKQSIKRNEYGKIRKIHIRYTRGIYNTGSHLFDMIRFLVGDIDSVRVLHKEYTSSELTGELSFTFDFVCGEGITGYAEAFNDAFYYLFEIDLYFEEGKIEITRSGDQIRYLKAGEHPLFEGFKSLIEDKQEQGWLAESALQNAMAHLYRVLRGDDEPVCNVMDGIYPLFVAEALMKSYKHNGSIEKVVTSFD